MNKSSDDAEDPQDELIEDDIDDEEDVGDPDDEVIEIEKKEESASTSNESSQPRRQGWYFIHFCSQVLKIGT